MSWPWPTAASVAWKQRQRPRPAGQVQFGHARPNRAGGDQRHAHAGADHPGDLAGQVGDERQVQPAAVVGQGVGADLDHDPPGRAG